MGTVWLTALAAHHGRDRSPGLKKEVADERGSSSHVKREVKREQSVKQEVQR